VKHIDGLEPNGHLPAVAEPSALLAGRRTPFICRKKTYNGITIAIALESFLWSESDRETR
jgi:cobalt-precorrin 5A hydrolase